MQENSIRVNGAITYWSIRGADRATLIGYLKVYGMENLAPPVRSDASALKLALKDHADGQSKIDGQVRLVQPHKKQSKNGFEVVVVDRGERRNSYTVDFSARWDEASRSIEVSNGYASTYELGKLFEKHKATLSGAAVGQCLVGVLNKLNGVSLRPSGGIYWLPEETLDTYRKVSAAIEECAVGDARNQVYVCRTLKDGETLRAVRDAIVNEIRDTAATLAMEIGEGKLGEEALENRKQQAMNLHGRIEKYEGFLGETLDVLHRIVETVEQSATLAALAAMD